MASTKQITNSPMVRRRCSFLRAVSKEASLARRLPLGRSVDAAVALIGFVLANASLLQMCARFHWWRVP